MVETTRFHPMSVAVELGARRDLRCAVPRTDKLHEQPDPERGQHAVRPNHLGAGARLAVEARVACDAFLCQDAEAPEARAARRRKHRLAADAETFLRLM